MPVKRVKKGVRSRAKNVRPALGLIHPESSAKSETKGYHRLAIKFATFAAALLGIIGLGSILEVCAAAPHLHVDYFDVNAPFRFPFVAANDSFITFYALQSDISFYLPDKMPVQLGNASGIAAELVSQAWGVPSGIDLSPGHRRDFYASSLETPPTSTPPYTHLEVSITLRYEVLPIIHWPREMTLGYKMLIASDGSRHWIEDDDVVKHIPNLRRGEKPPRPTD